MLNYSGFLLINLLFVTPYYFVAAFFRNFAA
jgi:hypothetical protein